MYIYMCMCVYIYVHIYIYMCVCVKKAIRDEKPLTNFFFIYIQILLNFLVLVEKDFFKKLSFQILEKNIFSIYLIIFNV